MKKLVLSLAVMGVFLAGCSEEKKESSAAVTQNAPVAVQAEKTTVVEKAKEEIATTAAKVQEKSVAPVEEVKKEITPAVESATAAVNEAEKAKESETTQAVEEAAVPVNQKGIDLYVKCAACHGSNGEKKALGTSQVIKGWSVEQTVSSLKGYKNKTYGGSMKTVMTSQVATLNDEDIEALAQLIATF